MRAILQPSSILAFLAVSCLGLGAIALYLYSQVEPVSSRGAIAGHRSAIDRVRERSAPVPIDHYIEMSERALRVERTSLAFQESLLRSVRTLAASICALGIVAGVGWWHARRLTRPCG